VKSKSKVHRIAIIGAAGGLGTALRQVCDSCFIDYTAIVRQEPERVQVQAAGSKIVVISNWNDLLAWKVALNDVDAVIVSCGVTSSSRDNSSLLSRHFDDFREHLVASQVKRVVIVSSLLCSPPGEKTSWQLRLFGALPGMVGLAAREIQSVVDEIGKGKLKGVDWTLVRGGFSKYGVTEEPVCSLSWSEKRNSFVPVSYLSIAERIVKMTIEDEFLQQSPIVSRRKRLQ
jgi:hypothetical protein